MKRYLWTILLLSILNISALAQPQQPPTRADCLHEIEEKLPRLYSLMDAQGVKGILLGRVANFSWITAGLGDSHIVITSDIGAVNLLLMRDGRRFAIAGNSEMPRMMAEDLNGLGYEAREFPWYDGARGDAIIKEIAGLAPLGTDVPRDGFKNLEGAIVEARTPLTDNEIVKYRWLCRETAEAVEEVARGLKVGMTERHIEALTSDALMKRSIRPTVILIGTDERIYNFRHATPTDAATLDTYGMVNVCARRWGLIAATTRFVSIGPVPPELQARLMVAAGVNAGLQNSLKPGLTSDQLLRAAQGYYAALGYPDEWQRHHQGGAVGYGERDWVIYPGGSQRVVDRQAFAFNPTVQGAKVEDTVLYLNGKIENLTRTGNWPELTSTVEGQAFTSPAILVLPR